jgi:hypothetical protein
MWLGRFRAICLALCMSVLTAGVASAASYEFPGPGGAFPGMICIYGAKATSHSLKLTPLDYGTCQSEAPL